MDSDEVKNILENCEYLNLEYKNKDHWFYYENKPISVVVNGQVFECASDYPMGAMGVKLDKYEWTVDFVIGNICGTGVSGIVKFYIENMESFEIILNQEDKEFMDKLMKAKGMDKYMKND